MLELEKKMNIKCTEASGHDFEMRLIIIEVYHKLGFNLHFLPRSTSLVTQHCLQSHSSDITMV